MKFSDFESSGPVDKLIAILPNIHPAETFAMVGLTKLWILEVEKPGVTGARARDGVQAP